MKRHSESHDARLVQALASMRIALQLLDEADASPDIGAHLDLAICRLEAAAGSASAAEVATMAPAVSSK